MIKKYADYTKEGDCGCHIGESKQGEYIKVADLIDFIEKKQKENICGIRHNCINEILDEVK
jgi:hypothetical protein